MKTLYHGSYTEVSSPLAKVGRRNLDLPDVYSQPAGDRSLSGVCRMYNT